MQLLYVFNTFRLDVQMLLWHLKRGESALVTLPGCTAAAAAAAAAGAPGRVSQRRKRSSRIAVVAGHLFTHARLRHSQRLWRRSQLCCLVGDIHRQRGCMHNITSLPFVKEAKTIREDAAGRTMAPLAASTLRSHDANMQCTFGVISCLRDRKQKCFAPCCKSSR